VVHFYVEDSPTSESLDQELGELHHQSVAKNLKCRFMRIRANGAPFITKQLNISNEEPSVICLHHGKIFQRLVDTESIVRYPGQVQRWAMDTGLMEI
jgi:hypothetical protein